jgi:hypothetical protein
MTHSGWDRPPDGNEGFDFLESDLTHDVTLDDKTGEYDALHSECQTSSDYFIIARLGDSFLENLFPLFESLLLLSSASDIFSRA